MQSAKYRFEQLIIHSIDHYNWFIRSTFDRCLIDSIIIIDSFSRLHGAHAHMESHVSWLVVVFRVFLSLQWSFIKSFLIILTWRAHNGGRRWQGAVIHWYITNTRISQWLTHDYLNRSLKFWRIWMLKRAWLISSRRRKYVT